MVAALGLQWELETEGSQQILGPYPAGDDDRLGAMIGNVRDQGPTVPARQELRDALASDLAALANEYLGEGGRETARAQGVAVAGKQNAAPVLGRHAWKKLLQIVLGKSLGLDAVPLAQQLADRVAAAVRARLSGVAPCRSDG